jgi:hypothetical protein
LYQQSHGTECKHNVVDGPTATRFLLGCVRQRVLRPSFRSKLEAKLRTIAARELGGPRPDQAVESKRSALVEARRKRERAAQNLALAEDEMRYKAISAVFEQLSCEEQALEVELRQLERDAPPALDIEAEVQTALSALDKMGELAADPTNLGSIGELFRRLNVRLFVSFREERPKQRVVNRVAGGVVTFGATPPPVPLYEGPTGRRALEGRLAKEASLGVAAGPALPVPPGGQAVQSLGNVSRGDSLCPFVTEIVGASLVRQVFPQTLAFLGDEVLQSVLPGLYRKHRKATDRG